MVVNLPGLFHHTQGFFQYIPQIGIEIGPAGTMDIPLHRFYPDSLNEQYLNEQKSIKCKHVEHVDRLSFQMPKNISFTDLAIATPIRWDALLIQIGSTIIV